MLGVGTGGHELVDGPNHTISGGEKGKKRTGQRDCRRNALWVPKVSTEPEALGSDMREGKPASRAVALMQVCDRGLSLGQGLLCTHPEATGELSDAGEELAVYTRMQSARKEETKKEKQLRVDMCFSFGYLFWCCNEEYMASDRQMRIQGRRMDDARGLAKELLCFS